MSSLITAQEVCPAFLLPRLNGPLQDSKGRSPAQAPALGNKKELLPSKLQNLPTSSDRQVGNS
jgi:hypothetical protein